MAYNRPGISEYGTACEGMFRAVCKKAQWKNAPLIDKNQLLRIMEGVNSKRLYSSLRGIEANGGDISEYDAKEVMDKVYGVDYLIQYPSEDGIVIVAIDITSDVGKIEQKAETLLKLKPAIKAGLNADMALVVYINTKRKAFGLLEERKQWEVIGHLTDRIEGMIAKGKWCGTVTL